jgi:AcrR family transcriptional regulator
MSEQSTFESMRSDERAARRQVIIEAAINILNKRPFIDIGVRDIAQQAGVSAASIYRYFPGLNDLLVEALTHEVAKIVDEFEHRMIESPLDIEGFTEIVVDYLMDNEATFQMMSYLMVIGQMAPAVLAKFNVAQKQYLRMFARVLEHAGISGDLRILSQAFFASLAGIAMTYRNFPGRNKEEIRQHMKRLAKIIANLFKQGLSGE